MATEQTHTRSTSDLPQDEALALYRRVRLIRRFEETVQALFLRGEVHGTTHLYIGQEAVATGVGSVLTPQDRVAATYRGHGHALAIGVDPQALLDEMLGRETGVCGGRAGSMNVVDLERGLIGCFGIVGGSIGAATGAALSAKLLGTGAVAVAFFGDGTSNQAYFHECLNWAQVEKLPVVFVCENNLYMEFTPIEPPTMPKQPISPLSTSTTFIEPARPPQRPVARPRSSSIRPCAETPSASAWPWPR